MYQLSYSVVFFLAAFILSHARHTVFTSENEIYNYLTDSTEPNVCMTPTCVISAAQFMNNMDETVDPCDDFYRFACGGWLKNHDVSEDKPRVSVDTQMKDDINRQLRDNLESNSESSEPPFIKMLKNFYKTCVRLEKDGSEPLKRTLSSLGGWPVLEGNEWDESNFDWIESMISIRKLGYNYWTLIGLYLDMVGSEYRIRINEPFSRITRKSNLTLGLDDPDIATYFRQTVKAAKLLGADESFATKEYLEVVKFAISLEESIYAKTENTKETEEEDFSPKEYTVKELQDEVPQILWLKYFNGMFNNAINENEKIYVESMSFFKNLLDLIASTKKRVIANYLIMHVILESSSFLSEDWNTIADIYNKMIMDNYYYEKYTEMKKKPLLKRCLLSVQDKMGIALNYFYVRCCFKKENKDEAMIILKYIHGEFVKILEENDWMDEETKRKAEEKANAVKSFIGYPEKLLNDTFVMETYENLSILKDSYLENMMRFAKMDRDEQLSRARKPFNFKIYTMNIDIEFVMHVNAFYARDENKIIIPAGILADAFYEKDRPNYLNFGGIGYVIGHEITHGFDDSGRKYDKDGEEVNWWDKESDAHFIKKAKCIIAQYDNYTTDIGIKVNGEKTKDENIADNGGLKEAYLAYITWTKDYGVEPTLPGLNYTQNQLFWLSAAYTFCTKYRPEKLKEMLATDTHSPSRFRIIGPMSNSEEFSKDFQCSADSPMNRKYKCKVW